MYGIRLGFMLLLILLVISGYGSSGKQISSGGVADGVCELNSAKVNYRLVNYVEILRDSRARLTITEVARPSFQSEFEAYREHTGALESDRWYWGKIQVLNRLPDAERKLEWVLFFSSSWTRLEVFTADRYGNWVAEPNGSFIPSRQKPFLPTAKGNLVKLSLPPGETVTVYFRGMSERPSLTPSFHLYLQTTEDYYDKLIKLKVSNAIFIGFLGMMLFYNLVVYFFGRDRSFIFYSGYLLMTVIYACYSIGDLPDWFGSDLFLDHPQYYGFFKLSIFIGLMFYLTFIRSFADLKHLLPGWDKYLKVLVYLGFPLMLVYVGVAITSNFSYILEDRITVAFIVIVIGSCCGLLYPLYRTRDKKGAFVFAGVAALSIGCLLSLMTRVAFPPFTLFYLKAGVVLEVLIFSLGLAYRQRKQIQAREQADFALRESKLIQEKQRLAADRLQEVTDFKTRFYTNITHEFRTPLTVIMGMSEQIEGHAEEKKLIKRNGQNLLRLINQLLDLSKLESGNIGLTWIHDDMVAYLRYLTESFYSAAEEKKIRFMFYAEQREIMMDFDEEVILQIVNNLISNALKFTSEGGKVIVHATKEKVDTGASLKLIVKDDGIGIGPEHTQRIFERFYQVDKPGSPTGIGTGVGLALTKELVELMEGTLSVTSELGGGSEFLVHLPIREAYRLPDSEHLEALPADDRPELLVIEDSRDIIAYLQSLLADRYHFHFATDGAAGIEKARELVPDIIISDVMMPEKDGFEVCETLKSDERTSHVPIILLTAKTTHAARIEGLKYGAEAYLTKPFEKEELLVRLEKLIEIRHQLQLRYADGVTLAKGSIPSGEEVVIQKLHGLIQERLDDPNFGVSELAAAAHLSQMQLYRKLKAVTGKTPSRFIRSYRLRQGMALLRQGQMTVSEIAYSVGFSDPSYFSRTFQQEFKNSPSHYINN